MLVFGQTNLEKRVENHRSQNYSCLASQFFSATRSVQFSSKGVPIYIAFRGLPCLRLGVLMVGKRPLVGTHCRVREGRRHPTPNTRAENTAAQKHTALKTPQQKTLDRWPLEKVPHHFLGMPSPGRSKRPIISALQSSSVKGEMDWSQKETISELQAQNSETSSFF